MVSIRTSLIQLSILAFFIALLAAGSSFWLMNSAASTQANYIEQDSAIQQEMTRLFTESIGLRLATLSRLANPDSAQPTLSFARALKEIEAATLSLQQLLVQFNKQDKQVTEILTLKDAWLTQVQSLMEAAEAENRVAIEHQSLPEGQAWQSYRNPFLEVISSYSKASQLTLDAAEQQRATAIYASVLVSAALLVLFVLFAFNIMRRVDLALGGDLAQAVKLTRRMASGDFSAVIQNKGCKTSLLGALASMQDNLKEALKATIDAAQKVGESAVAIDKITSKTHRVAESQVDLAAATAASAKELTASAAQVAQSIAESDQEVRQARERLQTCESYIDTTAVDIESLSGHVEAVAGDMDALKQQTNEVQEAITIIRGIAEQTNLLALNAAIEAARAGEQGRGFAVVADEVRELANRSALSTQTITSVIVDLVSKADEAVKAMQLSQDLTVKTKNNSQRALQELQLLVAAMNAVSSKSAEIAAASEQQSTTITEVTDNVQRIQSLSEENASLAQESSQIGSAQTDIADRLDRNTSSFHL